VTRRRVSIVLAVVFAVVCAAVGAGAAASASDLKRVPAAAAKARAASTGCVAAKRLRARAACRRARSSAGYRRGARGGRAVLARPVVRVPGAITSPAGGAAPGPSTPPAPAPGTGTPPAGPGSPSPGVASSVGAEAYDFGTFVLRLTRTAVPAGDLTIYFRNHDISDHNLWLDAPPSVGGAPLMISEAVGENGGATKTVAVTPGTWRLYCSLLGHDSMTRDLAVQ